MPLLGLLWEFKGIEKKRLSLNKNTTQLGGVIDDYGRTGKGDRKQFNPRTAKLTGEVRLKA
ncbi:hypothetical protein [uncultured Nostoc sp.]|uniref:hypothetical protein n=1 Tax=uncultured Nostoc sp. TaxID=340711 RepID=UPI0035CC1F41